MNISWLFQCCSPQIDGGGGWGVFNSLFGWQNSATVGSVVSYNLYWLAVILGFLAMQYKDKKGHWPLMKTKTPARPFHESGSDNGVQGCLTDEKDPRATSTTEVRSTDSWMLYQVTSIWWRCRLRRKAWYRRQRMKLYKQLLCHIHIRWPNRNEKQPILA